MAQDSKSRKLDQYIVRFPDGMRDALKADADKNGRSMNAEIISRLVEYEHLLNKTRMLETSLKHEKLSHEMARHEAHEALARYAELERKQATAIPRDQTLYVVLDANGHPLSWSEVMTHLSKIAENASLNLERIDARVFDAKAASNSAREAHWLDLIKFYRKARKPSGKT